MPTDRHLSAVMEGGAWPFAGRLGHQARVAQSLATNCALTSLLGPSMPGRGKPRRPRGNKKRAAPRRVPRPISNGCIVKRPYNYGNLAYPGPTDAGIQIGITPSTVLDWSSFAAVWKRFRVLEATVHFVIWGQNDTTPAYSTIYVYHDVVSAGAPPTLMDALVQKGRRILSFSASTMHRQFRFVPVPWTSSGLTATASSPGQQWLPTTGGVALTSAAAWIQGFNSSSQQPGINVYLELLLHFDSPQ